MTITVCRLDLVGELAFQRVLAPQHQRRQQGGDAALEFQVAMLDGLRQLVDKAVSPPSGTDSGSISVDIPETSLNAMSATRLPLRATVK
jgi:hypothetical protein